MATVTKSPRRYAHSNGHVEVCFSGDGQYMVTCGSDGDMRVWLGIEDDDPTSKVVANEKAITVACHGNRAYVGSDNNCVNAYLLPDCSRDGIITRFTAPVTHISLSPDGLYLASGSCDMEVHVTNTSNFKGSVMTGHKGAILSVAMDPKSKYVASSSCDGSVIVWLVETQKVVHTWPAMYPPSNEFWASASLMRISWLTQSGRILAIPLKREVMLVHRDSWAQQTVMSDFNVQNFYMTTAFSPCGRMLAATSLDGRLSVWDIDLGNTVLSETFEPKLPLCGIAWNPSDDKKAGGHAEIALCDNQGHLGTIVFNLPSDKIVQPQAEEKEDEDADVEDTASITSDFDMAEVGADNRPPTSASSMPPSPEPVSKKLAVEQQEAFQPTSTPVHFKRRFMVWNDVGIVKAYDVEGDLSIDIEFHDTATHHPITVDNYLHHDKAALTKDVLVLSGEKQSSSKGSKVVCLVLQSWDGNKEWSTELPAGEETLALAAGDGFIAVATDKRNLRIFSVSGNQREILAIPGSVVCLGACRKQLMLVYHAAAGNLGDQAMTMLLLEVGTYSVRRVEMPQSVPLSPGVPLLWAGFTDEGNPCTYDHEGTLRVLAPSGLWHTLCDTTTALSKSVLDGIFMIGVNQSEQKMRGLLCKGAKYPHTQPRPNLAEFPINMPVCEPHTDKSKYEDVYMRMKLSVAAHRHDPYTDQKVDTSKRQFQECLLKLFAIAARQDLCMRACELYTCMPARNLRELARKYANNINKNNLLERLEQLDLDHESEPEEESPTRYPKPSVHKDEESYDDSYSEDNSSESMLQAAKRARLEARMTNNASATTPSQVNPFRKTSDKKVSGISLAPLPVQRQLSSLKKASPTHIEKPKKAALQTKLNVFSKTENKVVTPPPPDDLEEDIIEDSQCVEATKRHSQEEIDTQAKRMKTTSKLQGFAFNKN